MSPLAGYGHGAISIKLLWPFLLWVLLLMDFHKSKLKRKLLKLSNSSHHRHVWNQILSCILEAGEGTQETSHDMCAWERLNVFVYLDLNKKKLKLGIGWRIQFKDHQTQPGNILPTNIKIPGSKSASQTNPHLCQWTSPGVKWYSFIQHSDLLTWTQHRQKPAASFQVQALPYSDQEPSQGN